MQYKLFFIFSLLAVFVFAGTASAMTKTKECKNKTIKKIVYTIDGEIVKVNVEKHEIYILKSDKTVKFSAGIEFCKRGLEKNKAKVRIKYIIGDNGSLIIKEMAFINNTK